MLKQKSQLKKTFFIFSGAARLLQRRVLVLSVIAALIFTYAGLANDVATEGYQLSTATEEIASLRKTQANLELDIAAARSLPRVAAAVGSLSLVPASSIEYATPTATAVAVR
ncbi:hypothetical protein COV04_04685 [Candidatus Uhrbacteria bacterium CG10_big_fil_rev_8_21_14_0_10_48_11]|uniref:Cell division protein FtsL n=1 Tax=Candidatus Uhrbacteria bacterium CG10_big_fil_rev_8_21_14_0_10_48_11 TaxID=1975037 RepID=A0A2M8LDD8_9BACT|nr:MAG: hypothetical protein COV04_04685 [Candidatus Uhrbacteria bacterium CG10_big_fil_rev_8_21_14_0_10_48_11]